MGTDSFIRVALGYADVPKIEVLHAAFKCFKRCALIAPVKARSSVSAQPKGVEELLHGAEERARAALAATEYALLGIGLESGIASIYEFDYYAAVAVIFDREEKEYTGFCPGFPLPDWAIKQARSSDLGTVIKKRGGSVDPVKYFSDGTIDRTEILASAVKMALAPYLFPHRYMA